MAATAEKATDWMIFGAKALGLIAGIYAIYWIVDQVASTGGLKDLFKGVGDTASAAGTTLDLGLGALGFDFNNSDRTFPGYAAGNWNKLMSSAKNPFTASYKPVNPDAVTNPGPTAVKRWSDALYNEMGQHAKYIVPGINPDFNKIITVYEQIPDLDNVNLVYKQSKDDNDFDLALDINGAMISFTDTFKDIIAGIILQKS